MINIELYINNTLADVGDNFSVRLNRQLINPGELNTKDAQYSYSVNLPSTKVNDAIFNFANIEEVANKFNNQYTAQLIVNSIRVFVGNVRLTQVKKGYKGNLYVPAVKSVKDIFGDFNLNEIAEIRIPFADFAGSITSINEAARTSVQLAIFPYVLYGLLPKVPLDLNANNYSAREIWDDSVRVGIQDLPPSINPLLMLKHLFNSQGYQLQGTAFNDDRLTKLYMSYKNPSEYTQPWNYGYHSKIKLTGSWSSTRNKRNGNAVQYERGVNENNDGSYKLFTTDLFDAVNSQINVIEDPGGNVLYKEVNDQDNVTWAQTQVRIPTAGFYKVKFNSSLKIYDNENWRHTDGATGVQHLSGRSSKANNSFGVDAGQFGVIGGHIQEIKLVRDRNNADFGLQSSKLDGWFYRNNQPQNNTFDEENNPKYFPPVSQDGQINFVDLAQNSKAFLGFGFGLRPNDRSGNRDYLNPRDEANGWAQIQVAKPALSWDTSESDTEPSRIAVKSLGWWKFGQIGNFDSEDDNPDENIDYSTGTKVTGKDLDENGNVIDSTNVDNVILQRFSLQRYYNYVVDGGANFSGEIYLHAGGDVTPVSVIPVVNGVATFTTSGFSVFGSSPNITLYLKNPDFDVDGTLTITRQIEEGSEDIIDWEVTGKYEIELNNAPANYVKRGQFNNAPANASWNGQGEVNAVVWLEAGELLTVASVGTEGRYRRSGMHSTYGWVNHEVNFTLDIEPFRTDEDWIKVGFNGNGTAAMDWNDTPNFDTDSINLAGFLPSDVKANDFIENFVKAFNLELSQIKSNVFALNVKQSKAAVSNRYIDLDGIASVIDRTNTPLGLPSSYKLGFTVNEDEEGFYETGDDGGGEYSTGVVEEKVVTQKSSFSFNWFKEIIKEQNGDSTALEIPNISKHKVWTLGTPYPEAMLERFNDLAIRFWYFDGLLNDVGASFDFNGVNVGLAKVSNELSGKSVLDYKNKPKTILDNFFTILINSSSHYTEAEAYLTPAQYEALDGALLAKFNGDLYYVAELSGYDPSGRNKTKLKLIRKI